MREGKTEDQNIRACLLGPPRDDNRVRGADDGKGKSCAPACHACGEIDY
jgi:hypothetical protein